jgi:hypothetical protein
MPARARPEPACFSLTNLRMNLVAAGVNLQTADLSHFPRGCHCRFRFRCSLLVMTQHQLIGHPAKDWSRPVFKDQFPFLLAPEFWGSSNDSWVKTSLFVYDANAVRGSSGFEPL